MSVALARFGYKTEWSDIQVDGYEGYLPQMTDYHMHEYYEISLILSGKVNVLLSDMVDGGTHARLVLMRPHTPHYITCEPELLYRRRNLVFSPHFLTDFLPEIQNLMRIFGKNGMILRLNEEKSERFLAIFEQIQQGHTGGRLRRFCPIRRDFPARFHRQSKILHSYLDLTLLLIYR